MTTSHSATGRRRRIQVPTSAESVPQPVPGDPPIYRALLSQWADRGRTLPGRHDPEWTRLAASPAGAARLSAPRGPRGGGR
ncbi:hypothetical protein [Streptomyces physcomitrii]|uniref:DUF2934 domain-containing protein n=1 Tax=Streptomyces physcomitrii TaxID=2724184 RepID=A0ABX1H9E7_9ACTN|nr:hypothetical protein [Streptomyces physcomitrii]NKI43930.1 hypothetical protein [Streptomyces physcomitrii]